jgi:thiamine pyrophosphokinase
VPAAGPHAAILADGDVPSRAVLDAAWPGWAAGIELVVAADGGLRHAAPLGLGVQRWVGDGDSTSPADLEALAAAGASIRRVATDKDETDTELALLEAIDAGARSITVLGGLGGVRVDHALANVSLLLHPALERRAARLYDAAGARLSVLVAPDHLGMSVTAELEGRAGDLVSLIPLGGWAHHVETDGLRYPLDDEPLPLGKARGLSNVRLRDVARVTLGSGRLLVIETPATVRP